MKKIGKKFIIAIVMVMAAYFVHPGTVPAQDSNEVPDSIEQSSKQTPPGWDRGLKKGWDDMDVPPGLREKVEQLRRLREENPEKYQEVVKKRREVLRERLRKLRREDPERFKEIVNKRRERIKNRLERLRREDPERFKEMVEKRKTMLNQRLERIKRENPERFERIMKRREEYKRTNLRRYEMENRTNHRRPVDRGRRDRGRGGRR